MSPICDQVAKYLELFFLTEIIVDPIFVLNVVICVLLGWNLLRVKILQLCFFHLEPISSGTYIFTIPAGLNNVSRGFSFQLKSWHFFNLSYYWKLFWIFWQSCGMWLLNFLQNQAGLSSKISLSQIHFRYYQINWFWQFALFLLLQCTAVSADMINLI